MRQLPRILPAVVLLSSSFWAGCSSGPVYPDVQQHSFSIKVHGLFTRSLNGNEDTVIWVVPDFSDITNTSDSVLYVIVNGDTSFSRPSPRNPAVSDSSVPYHFDGRANYIAVVFPHSSVLDTVFEDYLVARIVSPAPGSSILRDSGINVGYHIDFKNASHFYQFQNVEVTDSLTSYEESVDPVDLIFHVPDSSLTHLRSGTIWAEIHTATYRFDVEEYAYYDRKCNVSRDRVVAYSLR